MTQVTTPNIPDGEQPDSAPATPRADADDAAQVTRRDESFSAKVQLAAIVALLSFLGSLGGTFFSTRIDETRWRREASFELRKEVFAKRTELLERTIRVTNSMQTLELLRASGQYASAEGESRVRKGENAQPFMATLTETAMQAKQVQADLSVVMTLDMVYFGPKMKRAVRDVESALNQANPWWKIDDTKTQALINALGEELNLGLATGD